MRKLYLYLTLSMLLLVAQQGAVFHELQHISQAVSHSTASQAQLHAEVSAEETCLLCQAYAQLAQPVSPSLAFVAYVPAVSFARSNPNRAAAPADTLNPRSRGPPSSALKS